MREFPQDGAAGAGFTNTGDALVMSPALLGKYLDAAKEVAAHAVTLPDGFRFSRATTRRDWTDELVADIRALYDRFADKDGKLPLEAYLAATIELRRRAAAGPVEQADIRMLAAGRGLSHEYLRSLWEALGGHGSRHPGGGPLDDVRARWEAAGSGDVAALAGAIRKWQGALWRFNSVAYAFDGAWQVPVAPLVNAIALRKPFPETLPTDEIVLYLSAGDAGDGHEGDLVVWRKPRLEKPGRPPLLLRDVRGLTRYLVARRRDVLARPASTSPPRPARRRAATGRRSPPWQRRTTSPPMPWRRGSTISAWRARRRCGSTAT